MWLPTTARYQMWFVHSGVMYEIVGMKGDEAWLANILKTWQFD